MPVGRDDLMTIGEMDDAGTEAPESPRHKPSRLSRVTLTLSIVMSGAALVLSSYALVVATGDEGATSPQSAATTVPSPSGTTEATFDPTAAASPEPAPSAAGDQPLVIPPEGDYQLVYENKHLTLNPTTGCGYRYIDLDQPLVGAEEATIDLNYYYCPNAPAPTLTFKDQRLASVASASPTPGECAQRIGAAPVETTVTPSQDLTLCSVTDGVGAANQPQRPKIVVLTVDAVSKTGVVNLTLSGWAVPP